MDEVLVQSTVFAIVAGILGIVGFMFFITRFLRKVEPGKALIVVNPFKKSMRVSFTGGLVIPLIHRAEVMDVSTKQVVVERRGKDGLICQDNIRADISVNFYMRVNNTEVDVRNVAQSIGVERASTKDTLDQLFQAKFSEALKTVGKQMDFTDLFKERAIFKEQIIKEIGQNLNGYSLEDTAIDYLEQTPLEFFDPTNIQDADGIQKITNITLTLKEQKEKRETEATERILQLDKQREEAKAKNEAEVAIIKAREAAETEKIVQEERLKSESARIKSDEEIQVAEANKDRQVEVALKNKERTAAVEAERVEKDRELEQTERTKLVALAEIEKTRAVEAEKKTIQEIIRQRVALERSVAEEEEQTKDTVAHATAEREKHVKLTQAAAEAEENLVLEIKSAEAKDKAAKFLANEMNIKADAELANASKISEAKKILAEGIIAEEAAAGIAGVKVQEANAQAIEKVGAAEANALQFKSKAEADAHEMKAKAEALAIKEKGESEALAIRAKGASEAQIINDKAESMKVLDKVGMEHEEFKHRLSSQERLVMERIAAQKEISNHNSKVIGKALETAKIDIVGGDAVFFDKLVGAIGNGKSIEAYFQPEGVLEEVKDAFLSGDSSQLISKIRGVIDTLGVTSKAAKDQSIANLLSSLKSETKDPKIVTVIGDLMKQMKKAGLDDEKSDILFNRAA